MPSTSSAVLIPHFNSSRHFNQNFQSKQKHFQWKLKFLTSTTTIPRNKSKLYMAKKMCSRWPRTFRLCVMATIKLSFICVVSWVSMAFGKDSSLVKCVSHHSFADAHTLACPTSSVCSPAGLAASPLVCRGEGGHLKLQVRGRDRDDTVVEIQSDHIEQKPLIFTGLPHSEWMWNALSGCIWRLTFFPALSRAH